MLLFWIELGALVLLGVLLIVGMRLMRAELAKAKTPEDASALVQRYARRAWVLFAGTAVIVIGIIISPLPGPGFTILGPIGIAILASEFAWAKRITGKIEEHTVGIRGVLARSARGVPRWLAAFLAIGYWLIVFGLAWRLGWPLWIWPIASPLFMPVLIWVVAVFRVNRPASTSPPAPTTPIIGQPDAGNATR